MEGYLFVVIIKGEDVKDIASELRDDVIELHEEKYDPAMYGEPEILVAPLTSLNN